MALNTSASSLRPKHGGNLAWAAALANCEPSSILDFSASINPLGPPASAIAAIQANLEHLRDYPDPTYTALKAALSQTHNIPAEWILPGNGSAELLTWAGRELAELDAVYLPTPAFGDYKRALAAYTAAIVPWAIDLHQPESALVERFTAKPIAPRTGLLLNNPHNPTGALFTTDFIRSCLERFAIVVVDEAFMDFLQPHQQQSVISWVEQYPNLVVLRSLTKFYSLAGLRLGYAIAHPERLQRWQQWRDPWSVNSLAVVSSIAILQDTQFQQQTWNWLDAARSHLAAGLSAFPQLTPYPSAANFLLVECASSVVSLQEQLLRQGRVLIRDCVSFPELGDRFFRVAVRTIPENQRLLDSLAEVLPRM